MSKAVVSKHVFIQQMLPDGGGLEMEDHSGAPGSSRSLSLKTVEGGGTQKAKEGQKHTNDVPPP